MKCHGCDAEIREEWPGAEAYTEGNPNHFQGDAALHLHITGGHGEFFDTIDGPEDLLLCHDCGHGIFALFPALVERFRGSHSLRQDMPMVDAMCWGLDGDEVVYGDGKRERVDAIGKGSS